MTDARPATDIERLTLDKMVGRLTLAFTARSPGDVPSMELFEWLWLLLSPFLVLGMVALEPRLLKLVGRYHDQCRRAGWCGLVMLLLAITVVSGWIGQLMFLVGAPLVGLAVWLRPGDDDDGEDASARVPPIDWDDFERAFRAHAPRQSPRPRSPSAP